MASPAAGQNLLNASTLPCEPLDISGQEQDGRAAAAQVSSQSTPMQTQTKKRGQRDPGKADLAFCTTFPQAVELSSPICAAACPAANDSSAHSGGESDSPTKEQAAVANNLPARAYGSACGDIPGNPAASKPVDAHQGKKLDLSGATREVGADSFDRSELVPLPANSKETLPQFAGLDALSVTAPVPTVTSALPPRGSADITPPAIASTAPGPVPPASSAHQVSVQISQSIAQAGAGGALVHRILVRLDPPELGKVEVHLFQPPDSGASVQISVERPATLALLHHDEAALHRALDQAGIPSEGRQVVLQLGGGDAGAGNGGAGSGGGWRGQTASARPGLRGEAGSEPMTSGSRQGMVRAGSATGLDITA
jgi:flagellar hook-length control protein FliK